MTRRRSNLGGRRRCHAGCERSMQPFTKVFESPDCSREWGKRHGYRLRHSYRMISVRAQFGSTILATSGMLIVIVPYVSMAVKANRDTVLYTIIPSLFNRYDMVQLDLSPTESVTYTATPTTLNQGFTSHYLSKRQIHTPLLSVLRRRVDLGSTRLPSWATFAILPWSTPGSGIRLRRGGTDGWSNHLHLSLLSRLRRSQGGPSVEGRLGAPPSATRGDLLALSAPSCTFMVVADH